MTARVFSPEGDVYVAGVDRFGLATAYTRDRDEAHAFPSRELAEKCAEVERRRIPNHAHEVQELTDG